jgi:regulator of protease activity HflC (stomatin/prohibitin superfamily)
MTDIFKVGAEAASFDGIETPDVALMLKLADDYRAEKARIIADFQKAVSKARAEALRLLMEAQEITRRQLEAEQDWEAHHD